MYCRRKHDAAKRLPFRCSPQYLYDRLLYHDTCMMLYNVKYAKCCKSISAGTMHKDTAEDGCRTAPPHLDASVAQSHFGGVLDIF